MPDQKWKLVRQVLQFDALQSSRTVKSDLRSHIMWLCETNRISKQTSPERYFKIWSSLLINVCPLFTTPYDKTLHAWTLVWLWQSSEMKTLSSANDLSLVTNKNVNNWLDPSIQYFISFFFLHSAKKLHLKQAEDAYMTGLSFSNELPL